MMVTRWPGCTWPGKSGSGGPPACPVLDSPAGESRLFSCLTTGAYLAAGSLALPSARTMAPVNAAGFSLIIE